MKIQDIQDSIKIFIKKERENQSTQLWNFSHEQEFENLQHLKLQAIKTQSHPNKKNPH